ncbi:MAG: DNA-directed RNA polymerase [Candidatus Lokiarchaeota archaeon]|nr:DNA-directed RNA polymerase [Candidatus Lokiarchaeota archaeon]
MFKLIDVSNTVRIPPSRFGEDIEVVAKDILKHEYEDKIFAELGYVISIGNIIEIKEGKIIPGDGATYHRVFFEVLALKPDLNEIIHGEIVEIVDFGVFIQLGCMDGLCHISQITNDFFSYNEINSELIGKETGKLVKEKDIVRARIVALSIGTGSSRSGKLGLTMRHPFLGKIDWINDKISGFDEIKEAPEIEDKGKDKKKKGRK